MSELKRLANEIAVQSFFGHLDKAGQPYIFHLYRVAANFKHDETLYIIALLHDLLEDCPEWTLERLAGIFPARIANAVKCLTKQPSLKYKDYIDVIGRCPDARLVKIADLKDNMDVSRVERPLDEQDIKRLLKYHEAYCFLSKIGL